MKLNTVGYIKDGYLSGWYIFVQPMESGGGYLIIYVERNVFDSLGNVEHNPEIKGYDDWVMTLEEVQNLIEDYEMIIEWLEEPSG